MGWSNRVRGGTAVVVTDPAIAHSGNNCISNYNATGWSSAAQGDSLSSAYGTGVSLPVSGSKYYKLSAYVKVPGASTTPRNITLRYRFEPSGNRVDVGTKGINTEAWTLLESPWIQPAAADTYMSYWEVHSVDNAVIFYADDCALFESNPFFIQGRVVGGGGAGVDGATVVATSATAVSPSATTAGGGYYTIAILPDPGTYTVGASTPGFKGSTTASKTPSHDIGTRSAF